MSITGKLDAIEARLSTKGLTISQLCDEVGIARSTWQRWKAGVHSPNMKTFDAVEAACENLCAPREDAA